VGLDVRFHKWCTSEPGMTVYEAQTGSCKYGLLGGEGTYSGGLWGKQGLKNTQIWDAVHLVPFDKDWAPSPTSWGALWAGPVQTDPWLRPAEPAEASSRRACQVLRSLCHPWAGVHAAAEPHVEVSTSPPPSSHTVFGLTNTANLQPQLSCFLILTSLPT